MTRFLLYCLSFIYISSIGFAQTTESEKINITEDKRKIGKLYFTWGYTRAWYSKSDIHISNNTNRYYPETGRTHNYDFTVYDAKASDRPDFDQISDLANITIPQFVFRVGYYFKKRKDIGIELNYDHAKYVVNDFQKAKIKGNFNGNYVDTDTILDPKNLLHFEHTDGANFWMLNFVKRWTLFNPSRKIHIGYVLKPGAGIVFPRTDVTVLGTRMNNDWHVAGWVAGLESGLRIEFLKYGVFEFVGKGAFADYRRSLVLGKNNGTAKHHFFAAQLTATIGFML
jgi:hypothetical protein